MNTRDYVIVVCWKSVHSPSFTKMGAGRQCKHAQWRQPFQNCLARWRKSEKLSGGRRRYMHVSRLRVLQHRWVAAPVQPGVKRVRRVGWGGSCVVTVEVLTIGVLLTRSASDCVCVIRFLLYNVFRPEGTHMVSKIATSSAIPSGQTLLVVKCFLQEETSRLQIEVTCVGRYMICCRVVKHDPHSSCRHGYTGRW